MGGVEYQVTKVDPTDTETKGMVYQVHKVSEEVAATLGGKVYRARIIKDPTEPTVAGKIYQIVLIDDPDDPAVKGKVYNAILTGGSEVVVVGPAVSPLALDDAIADSLTYVKAFGGTEQNGTPTPDAPMDIVSNNGVLKVNSQGQIYADGTVETINVHGKNLFDITSGDWGAGYVQPNTTYTFSFIKGSAGRTTIYEVSNSEELTQIWTESSSGELGPKVITFTTGPNASYIRLNSKSTITFGNAQLEKGSTATTYEPYYDGGTATAEMLLKVGDYKDVQEILSGAVTRNVGVKVLDGTEGWSSQTAGAYSLKKTSFINPKIPADSTDLLCTHFVAVSSSVVIGNIWVGNNYINFFYDGSTEHLADFKQWLADQYAAGTPVIVVYPLATPTTESVTGQTLQVQDGDNTLEITQASIDGLELEAEYEKET